MRALLHLAEHEFLGSHVVGVGIADEEGKVLVFLLKTRAPIVERQIYRWSRDHGISAEVSVAGDIRPAV